MYKKILIVVVNLACFVSCTSSKRDNLIQNQEVIEANGSESNRTFNNAICESIQLPKEIYSIDDVHFVSDSPKDLVVTAKLRNATSKIFSLKVEENLKTTINQDIASIQDSKIRAIFSKRSGDQILMLVYMKERGIPIAQWHSVSESGPSKIVSITLPSEVIEHEVQSLESRVYVTLRHSMYESSFLILDLLDAKNPLKRINYTSQSRNSKFIGSSRGSSGFVIEKITDQEKDAFKLTTVSLETLEVVSSKKVISKHDSVAIESVDFSVMADSAIVVASVGDSMLGEASIADVRIDLSNQPNEFNWSNKIEFKDSHLSEVRLIQSKQEVRVFVFDWVSEKPKLSRFKLGQQGLVKDGNWQGFYSGSAVIDASRLTDDWLLAIRAKRGENYVHQICRVN
jgi:hypothetical protein